MSATVKRFIITVLFAVGLAYIETAVVVYLREIFYVGGFIFPIADQTADPQWLNLIPVEVGREAATLVVLLTSAWLIGSDFSSRLAYFLTVFAVWDIFYYVWLKVLLNWPVSIMDWDILFLIPALWASPVLAPVLISLAMLGMAVAILYRQGRAKPLRAGKADIAGFVIISVLIIAMFCRAGLHITQENYQAFFSWPIFLLCLLSGVLVFIRCWFKS